LRQPASSSFSKELTLQEQKVIADTVRRHSVANLLIAAQSLRFDFAFERLRDLPESVVYAQEKRSDGRIRVYVGVPDQSATGGYRPYARYLLERREDGWSIVNDF
jgi:hypothetical protein